MRWLIILGVISIVGYWVSPTRLAYTFDTSLPYKWWIEVDRWRSPRVGDYVLIDPPVKNEYTRNKVLVKKVVCKEGDYIRTVGLDYYCNNVYLGRARTTDSKGKPVEPVLLNQVIGKGYYFVMGETERSYDSRYMGLIPEANIKKFMYPLSRRPNLDFLFLKGVGHE